MHVRATRPYLQMSCRRMTLTGSRKQNGMSRVLEPWTSLVLDRHR